MFIVTLTMCLLVANTQVDHTVLPLSVKEVHIKPTIKTIPSQHNFKVEFKDFGHDIHGAVYETNRVLLD